MGVLPYRGYISMCGPKGYHFSAVLVIKILIEYIAFGLFSVKIGYGFCTLILSCVGLEKATFFIIIDKNHKEKKALQKVCLAQLCQLQWS